MTADPAGLANLFNIGDAIRPTAQHDRRLVIQLSGAPPPGVNKLIWEGMIDGDALEAANALPAGSARSVVSELREATLKLLGLLLQRSNTSDDDAETLNRCKAEGHLTAGVVREILNAADHVLSDRYWVARSDIDQHLVGGVSADELLQFSEGRDHRLDGIDPLVESLHKLVGELEIVRDRAGIKRLGHSQTPRVARALTRYVTGAIVAASRWMQRRAWVRRPAATAPRASDTNNGGTE